MKRIRTLLVFALTLVLTMSSVQLAFAANTISNIRLVHRADGIDILTWDSVGEATYRVERYLDSERRWETVYEGGSTLAAIHPSTEPLHVRFQEVPDETVDLSGFRTVWYADVFKKGSYTVELKIITSDDLGMDKMTLASKNGNINMQTTIHDDSLGNMDAEMRYIKSSDKLYVYAMGMWIDGKSLLGEDDAAMLDQMNIFASLELDDLSRMEKTSEEIDGVVYSVETVYGQKNDTKFYYIGDALKRIVITGGGMDTAMDILSFSPTADDSLFTEPAGAIDIGGLMSAPNPHHQVETDNEKIEATIISACCNHLKALTVPLKGEERYLDAEPSKSDSSATKVIWDEIDSAERYAIYNRLTHYADVWTDELLTEDTSFLLRLPPKSDEAIRVKAYGKTRFRISAISKQTGIPLASVESVLESCIAFEEALYTTPAVDSLKSTSSSGLREAYTLMLTQAVNNTRYEPRTLTMNAETELKSSATMLGETAEDQETSTTTCTFRNSCGEATHTVTKSDGTKTTTNYTLWQYYAITPNAGMTFLYDQHDLTSFQKGVKSVSAVDNADGSTTVTVVLNKEPFDATTRAVYHSGFLDSIADNGDQIAQYGNKAKISNASIGETTITAKINKNYTLDSYEIMNPFTMDVTLTLMLIPHTAPMVSSSYFKYTFTRESCENHQPETIKGYPASCMENGYTDGQKCSLCGEIIKAQEMIPALGHAYIDHAGKVPTCTKDGWYFYQTCTRCDYTSFKVRPANGHTEVTDPAISATCTKAGLSAGVHCSVCNAVLVPQIAIPAHGHDFALKNILDATCTDDGKRIYVCKYDDAHQQTETIPALGHKDSNGDGVCDRCKAKINRETEDESAPSAELCKYCGEIHEGFFGKLIGFFHSILALFGLRK